MKRITIIISTVLLAVLLVGCSVSVSKDASSETPEWTSKKDQQLNEYISKKDSTYKQYTKKNTFDFNGIKLPDELKLLDFGDEDDRSDSRWSTNGHGNADYNVVAIYSNVDSVANKADAKAYFFMYDDGYDPVVRMVKGSAVKTLSSKHNYIKTSKGDNSAFVKEFKKIARTK